jgi:hypothetical protein
MSIGAHDDPVRVLSLPFVSVQGLLSGIVSPVGVTSPVDRLLGVSFGDESERYGPFEPLNPLPHPVGVRHVVWVGVGRFDDPFGLFEEKPGVALVAPVAPSPFFASPCGAAFDAFDDAPADLTGEPGEWFPHHHGCPDGFQDAVIVLVAEPFCAE